MLYLCQWYQASLSATYWEVYRTNTNYTSFFHYREKCIEIGSGVHKYSYKKILFVNFCVCPKI